MQGEQQIILYNFQRLGMNIGVNGIDLCKEDFSEYPAQRH